MRLMLRSRRRFRRRLLPRSLPVDREYIERAGARGERGKCMLRHHRRAAHSGIYSDVLTMIRTEERDRLPDHARAQLLRPEYLARARVHRSEPAVHRAVEHEV